MSSAPAPISHNQSIDIQNRGDPLSYKNLAGGITIKACFDDVFLELGQYLLIVTNVFLCFHGFHKTPSSFHVRCIPSLQDNFCNFYKRHEPQTSNSMQYAAGARAGSAGRQQYAMDRFFATGPLGRKLTAKEFRRHSGPHALAAGRTGRDHRRIPATLPVPVFNRQFEISAIATIC